MGVGNPNRAAACALAAIAGLGALAGLVISATTTSVNAGAGAGAALAAPAPATTPGSASGLATSAGHATSAAQRPATRPGRARSGNAGEDPTALSSASMQTAAARRAVAGSPGPRPLAGSTSATGSSPSSSSAPTTGPSPGTPASAGTNSPGTNAAAACSPGEVSVSTTTDAGAYQPGAPVRITTTVRDVVACVFEPEAPSSGSGASRSSGSSGGDCATTVDVTDAQGDQVWPVPGQVEQCAPPAATALVPGQTLDVTVVWTGLADLPGSSLDLPAPPGRYRAAGTWSWSGSAGKAGSSGAAPVTVTAESAPFTLG